MFDFNSMLEAWRDPTTVHATLVHMPIALAILGALVTLILAIMAGSNRTLRLVAICIYVLLMLCALMAAQSGKSARSDLDHQFPREVYDLMDTHEQMASNIWLFAVISTAVAAGTMAKTPKIQKVTAWIAFFAGSATLAWVGATAHHGGTLVYEWGVGTPKPVAFMGAWNETPRHETEREGAGAASPDAGDSRLTFFIEEARPILAVNCVTCHNSAGMKNAGNLDQMSITAMLEGGRSGPAIVPGRPEDSILIKALRGEIEDLIMPPPGHGEPLTGEQIDILEQWVRDGAVWPAFEYAGQDDGGKAPQ